MHYVSGMKKYLFLISQLTLLCNFVLFNPQHVKMYQDLKALRTPIMKRQTLGSVYVLSIEFAYVDKT